MPKSLKTLHPFPEKTRTGPTDAFILLPEEEPSNPQGSRRCSASLSPHLCYSWPSFLSLFQNPREQKPWPSSGAQPPSLSAVEQECESSDNTKRFLNGKSSWEHSLAPCKDDSVNDGLHVQLRPHQVVSVEGHWYCPHSLYRHTISLQHTAAPVEPWNPFPSSNCTPILIFNVRDRKSLTTAPHNWRAHLQTATFLFRRSLLVLESHRRYTNWERLPSKELKNILKHDHVAWP